VRRIDLGAFFIASGEASPDKTAVLRQILCANRANYNYTN